jgi:zinc protease
MPSGNFRRLIPFAFGALMMLAEVAQIANAAAKSRAGEFKLANGMQVVVIPDRRAPVVTHMVWYRVGAADEPRGVSGIAHFLEHLMFKSTDKIKSGDFSKIVSRLGGQDNAFTSQDATAYFQRIARERLPEVMRMEADRMINLKLTEQEVLTERDVILEERRSRVENNPSSILDEQMNAALYYSHPYGIPVIGWEHEIARLTREDALAHYKRYYAPNNAILVVSGDVSEEEVRKLAEETFGAIPANPAVTARTRPRDPQHRSARRLELRDPRAGKTSVHRYYIAPSYGTAAPGEAEALDLLMKIAAEGATSRLYRKLVVEDKVASSASGYYYGSAMDSGKISVQAVAADGIAIETVEAAIDAVLADIRSNGVSEAELTRARNLFIAEYVYQSDNQSSLARRYGFAMVTGRTIGDIEGWPDRIAKVTTADIKAAAEKHLDIRRSVTGTMIPAPPSPNRVTGAPADPARATGSPQPARGTQG